MGKEVGLGVYFYGKVDELLGQLEKVEQRVSKLNRRFATFDKGLEAVRAQTKGTVKEFGNFTKAQDWIDKSFTKGSVAHKQYTSTLKQVEGALTKQAAVIRASGGDWKKFINNSDRLISTQKVMAGELKVTKKGLEAVGTATKTSGKQFDTYGKQIGRVKGGIEKFTAAMKVTAAYSLATGVIYGLVHAITDAVSAIIDYDQALKNLQAITSATDAQMLIMGKTIKEVASTTKYSVSEVAEAAILLGQAGFTAEESVDGIRAVALLATGTLTDMSTSADLVTTAVRAFGLQATDTSKIADIFASAVNRSKLTIDKIRTAFNYIGPVAHKAGLSLEETAAGAMLLANTGLRASTIGTGFRQVLSRLIAPTDRLRTAFVAAGADLSKLNPQMSSMESIIEELTKVVPNAQRAFELFGLRGAAAVSAFTEAGVEGYRAMIKEVYRVGVAQQMANKQMEGLGVMSKNLADKLGLLAVAIGEGGVAFAIRLFLKVARPMVDLLTVLADSTVGRVTVAVAFLTAGILALKVASTYLIVQLSALVLGYTALEVKMMVAAKGSGLITVATTALTTAFKKLWAVMAANPWVAIVSAIGLVVVSIATYIEKLSNLTIEIEANIIEINKQVKSLEAYRKQLNNTEKGSVEYIAVLQRLLNDYPELKKHVDLATMSFRDEGKALDKLIQSTYDKKLSSMIDLYEEYGNKVQRAQVKTVLWGSLVENVSRQFELMGFSLEGVGKAWDKVSSWVGNAVDYILGGIASLSKETQKIEALTIQQTDALKNLADEMKGYGVVAGASIATITAVLEKHTDMSVSEVRKMASAIQAYLNESAESALKNAELVGSLGSAWAEIYQKVDESRKQDILNEYKAFNEREALYFKDALAHAESGADKNETEKKYKEESEARLKEMLATIVKRENIVVDLKKTSMERQLDLIDVLLEQEQQKYDLAFVNLLVAKQKELSAVENNEVKKLEVVAKYKELETQLSNDSFSVMTALSEKKVSLIKDINAKSLRNTAEYFALVKELADRSHNELVELLGTRLKKELIAISEYGLSEKEVLLAKYYAHVAHNEKISKEHDRHFKELTQLANETYDGILLKVITSGESAEKQEKEILEAKKQRNEEIKQLYEDRSQAYKAVIDNLISEEERLTSAIRTAQEERDKIVQTGDDLIRELNYKLMTDLEEWNSEKIRADELLAQSNEELQNGNITRAGEYATEARSIYNGLAKEVKDESGKTIMSVGETVKIAVEGVTKSTEALQNIFSEKIGVFKTELTSVRDRIQETERAFSKFKQEIASFNKQAKLTLDVTPTLKALSKAKSAVDSYIAKLNSIPKRIVTAIVTKRVSIEAKEGGLITEPAHMAFGGKVPGSGAGDIVPAMLEPGEFVEPKSTVKEYGSGIFEALRSRMIPKSKVHALVPSIKMAAGGGVPTKLEYLSNLNPDIDPSNLLTGGQSSADAYSPSGGLSSKDIFAYTTELKQIPTNIVTALVAPVEEVMGDVSSYTAALKAIPNNIISAITSTVIQSTAEIMDYLKSLNKIPTDVDTSITASTEQVTGDVNAYTDELQGVPTDVGTSFTASTENATSNVNNYDSILTRIPRNVVTSFISPIKSVMASTGIYVNKLNEIPKVVNTDVMAAVKAGMASVNSFIHSLNKIPRNIITVLSTVQGKQGGGLIAPIRMAFGGGVPGSGAGDTVPAMLEPGEFVEPKSVVKEYGSGFFEALRAKIIPKAKINALDPHVKMAEGGIVPSGVGSSLSTQGTTSISTYIHELRSVPEKIITAFEINTTEALNQVDFYENLLETMHKDVLAFLDNRLAKEVQSLGFHSQFYDDHNRKVLQAHSVHLNGMIRITDVTYDAIIQKVIDSEDSIESKKKQIISAEKQRNETIRQLYKENINYFILEEKRLVEAVKSLQAEKISINASAEDVIRNLKYKTLTSEEQWNAERKRAQELLSQSIIAQKKGEIEASKEYAAEAKTIYNSLAVEIRDVFGKVTKTIEETVKIAIDGVSKSIAQTQSIFKIEEKINEERLKSIQKGIDITQKELFKFNQKAVLRIDSQPAIDSLIDAEAVVLEYIETIDDIPVTVDTNMVIHEESSVNSIDNYIDKLEDIPSEINTKINISSSYAAGAKSNVGDAMTMAEFQALKEALSRINDGYKEMQNTIDNVHDNALSALGNRLEQELSMLSKKDLSERQILEGAYEAYVNYQNQVSAKEDDRLKKSLKNTDTIYKEMFKIIKSSSASIEEKEQEIYAIKQQRHDNARKAYADRMSAYEKSISFFVSEEKRLTSVIQSEQAERANIVATGENIIRNLKQQLMTEEEKWRDDKSRADQLIAQSKAKLKQGDTEEAKQSAFQARSIYQTLAGEVKNESGEIVKSIGETVKIAIAGVSASTVLLEQISVDKIKLVNKVLTDTTRQIISEQKELSVLQQAVVSYNQNAVLDLNVNKTLNSLTTVVAQINMYKQKLDSIPKEITTVIRTVQKAVHAKAGGLISSIGMAFGGGVPGSGTGDTVPTMLEPGEFVEPKSVVKEYGIDLFEALRAKLIPKGSVQSLLSNLKMQTGGVVSSFRRASIPVIQRMQAGGEVQSKGNLYTIKFAIGNESHQLYGEEDSINSLVNNLRRSQLVTV